MLRKTVKELGFHSLLYMVGGLASSLASIVLLPVYTRYLSPEDYGIIEIIDSIRSLLIVILLAGFVPATAKFYKSSESLDEQKAVVGTSFWFICISSLLWSLGLFFFNRTASRLLLGEASLAVFINLGIVLLFFQAMLTTGNNYLNIQKKSKLFLVASLLKLVLNIGANLLFIVVMHLGAKGMLYGELLSTGVVGLWLIIYVGRHNSFPLRLSMLRSMMKFGLPFIPNALSSSLMHRVDRYLLRELGSLSDVGIYGLGYRFPFMLNFLILGSFGRIWNAAAMYEIAKQEHYQRTFAKITTYFMTLYVVCQYSMIVMAPTMIKIIAAPDYFEAWKIVQIVGLGMCLYSFHQFFIIGAFIKNKTWYLPIAYTLSAAVNIALNWLLIPRYGYIAAAWTTVATYAVFSFSGYALFQKIYPIPFEFRRLTVLFVLGSALALLNNLYFFPDAVLECLKELVFAAAFPLILLISPYLNCEERGSLREELHKIHPGLAALYSTLRRS
ncbi:hypothetical protein CSB45_04925 [candidate division KSB3 bacterium]|uniref:Uncharacterized protein n=1 Tax=candidate division KSB3 bacterium TaxID=2044937 RepID=A0A2G6E7J7_9BACT|nr:MAG: hypothetical protein CSB45_04925 [candidate division KSB3 bacterium]PIE30399.1 MAG: hypothetical protein CSA57_03695 [candidate division KSB3 bacterium]